MPIEQIPGNPNIEEVNERLNDGLRTCRSVVANYKALLAPDQNADEPSNDESDGAAKESGEGLT